MRCWDADSGQLLHVLAGESWLRCVLTVDERVWTGADDAAIRVYNQRSGRLELDLRGHRGAVHCLCIVGREVWSGGADRAIRVWAAHGGRALRELHGHAGWVNDLLLREPHVWSASVDRTVRVWNAVIPNNHKHFKNKTITFNVCDHSQASGNCYRVLHGHVGWVSCLLGVGRDRVWSGGSRPKMRSAARASRACWSALRAVS